MSDNQKKRGPGRPKGSKNKKSSEVNVPAVAKSKEAQVREMRRLEEMPIPEDFDYTVQRGLRLEAIEKLCKIRQANIGQASRISGVSPADISVLVILLRQQ